MVGQVPQNAFKGLSVNGQIGDGSEVTPPTSRCDVILISLVFRSGLIRADRNYILLPIPHHKQRNQKRQKMVHCKAEEPAGCLFIL